MPFKHFLGYERGEGGVPVINEKEAEVVRMIYGLFLEGKTAAGICKHLMSLGIPTPGGKTKWCQGTVMSILQNEKYKGDALLQKKFTVDFLTKKQKVKGLTTAAGLWASGLIGLAIGSGFYEGAILGTALIILVETYFETLRAKIRVAPEFEIALSYYHRNDLDDVLRYCKDNDIAITNLKVTGSKDSDEAMYSALITLKADGDNEAQDEIAREISRMSGIISAELI